MHEAILARSFSKHEKRKLGVWAFLSSLLIGLVFCALLKAYSMGPLPALNLQLSRSIDFKVLSIMDASSYHKARDPPSRFQIVEASNYYPKAREHSNSSLKSVDVIQPKNFEPLLAPIQCNFSQPRSDFCEINGDVRLQGNSSTIFIISASKSGTDVAKPEESSWSVRPYARKIDRSVMSKIREFSLKSSAPSGKQSIARCTKNHTAAGVVFSIGGYAGNHFHDFTDVIIPLYITSRQYKGNVEFLIANIKPYWLAKYSVLLKALSKYDIINIDQDREIHCFPSMIVGLKAHKELSIDPSRSFPNRDSYSMRNFTQFLRSAYWLKRNTAISLKDRHKRKPRLLIISRKMSRALMNEDELAAEARRVGYDVVVADARGELGKFARMVNSFDVMMGVHGAGLANSVFLPEKAVLIQVVPLGLEGLSKYDFELPAKDMNLRYLEYKISAKESSLTEKYPSDHPALREPSSFNKGWDAFKAVYLDGQNVSLDVSRFRTTLLKAIEFLHHN
ncbi:hypothetical protein Nepgr_018905 [Nepenthes gracilis]|uniref:Glycosyltransferase 61 catalytic domain-containing protein n=1 Tax=Nepenthes gracilis TaxID=150966 RepID=A0AAD3SU90_NEPGR|nr:hypothetical protein Nepgr_018905 [Nepenthes gracilis]